LKKKKTLVLVIPHVVTSFHPPTNFFLAKREKFEELSLADTGDV
jgi:hypothetical protein